MKMLTKQNVRRCRKMRNRCGQSTLDYVLILGVVLPLLLFLFSVVPRMIRLVYEMTVVLIGSPFL